MDIIPPEDIQNINHSVENSIDFLAVPCVDCKEDLEEVRDLLSVKGRHIKLLAKV